MKLLRKDRMTTSADEPALTVSADGYLQLLDYFLSKEPENSNPYKQCLGTTTEQSQLCNQEEFERFGSQLQLRRKEQLLAPESSAKSELPSCARPSAQQALLTELLKHPEVKQIIVRFISADCAQLREDDACREKQLLYNELLREVVRNRSALMQAKSAARPLQS